MRALSGPLVMVVGSLGLLYVPAFHSQQLAAIAHDGFFDAVELDPAQVKERLDGGKNNRRTTDERE